MIGGRYLLEMHSKISENRDSNSNYPLKLHKLISGSSRII